MNKQEYLLACLAEECSEVTKSATKALRFGLDDYVPDRPTNREKIKQEFFDILGVIGFMLDEKMFTITEEEIFSGGQAKIDKLKKYMEYSRQSGTLED